MREKADKKEIVGGRKYFLEHFRGGFFLQVRYGESIRDWGCSS